MRSPVSLGERSRPFPPRLEASAGVLGRVLVVLSFGALFLAHASEPPHLVFDEMHYVPAAQALAHLERDLNWEHPPLAKWIMGLAGRLLSGQLHLVSEPAVYRLVAAAFGLWALLSVGGFLRDAGLDEWAAQSAVWLTGVNFLWFVQSRTAMLDIFSVAFALAGLRRIRRGDTGLGNWMAWALLGLAMACKWSAAPYCILAVFWAHGPLRLRVAGVAVAFLAYVVPFLPLALLANDPTPLTGIAGYQLRMLQGFQSVDLAQHPYASHYWQWPTLLRPIWYSFESTALGERSVWAGGNPLLYALALPATAWIGVRAVRRDAAPVDRTIALLYWSPLLFWAALPRSQLYYYFLPSSLWLGPAVVQALIQLCGRRRRLVQIAIVALTAACAALFLWFSPIFDGRLEPRGTFVRYMWTPRWR